MSKHAQPALSVQYAVQAVFKGLSFSSSTAKAAMQARTVPTHTHCSGYNNIISKFTIKRLLAMAVDFFHGGLQPPHQIICTSKRYS